MKKKLLVILGAGSSGPLGFPSVSDLDQLMKGWAQQWTTGKWGEQWDMPHGFPNHFDDLWRAVESYYQAPTIGPRPRANFERVLSDMVALAHWMEPAPRGDTLRQVVCDGGAPTRLAFAYPERYGPTHELMQQVSYLLKKLAEHVRKLSMATDLASDSWHRYWNILGGLREAFDLGVYNLNYDTAALDALPGAYTGFSDKGFFEPSVVHKRNEWNFVYHLHGSVHYSLDRQYVGDIVWRQSLDGEFFDGPEGLSSDPRSNGVKLPRTTLVAGGFKLDQLLVEPFQSFHASLVRHVYTADAILIGGYGFGDVHVNLALQNRLIGGRARLPVMILDRADDKTDPMAFRNDLWTQRLCSTLRTDGSHFFGPGCRSTPPVPADLAGRGVFEVDPQHRVAIWYGGFVEAEQRLAKIVQWLGGAADEILVPGSGQ